MRAFVTSWADGWRRRPPERPVYAATLARDALLGIDSPSATP